MTPLLKLNFREHLPSPWREATCSEQVMEIDSPESLDTWKILSSNWELLSPHTAIQQDTELTQSSHGAQGVTRWLLSASLCSFPCTLLSGFLSQLRSRSLCKPQSRAGNPLPSWHHAGTSLPEPTKVCFRGSGHQRKGSFWGFCYWLSFLLGFYLVSLLPRALLSTPSHC